MSSPFERYFAQEPVIAEAFWLAVAKRRSIVDTAMRSFTQRTGIHEYRMIMAERMFDASTWVGGRRAVALPAKTAAASSVIIVAGTSGKIGGVCGCHIFLATR